MIICTAATKRSIYEPLLDVQRQRYGDRIITYLMPETSWGEGTKIKPQAIRQALNSHDHVLWMDADCTIDLPNDPPEGDYDVCIFDNIHPHHINRISAAFIMFRQTVGAFRFLRDWEINNRFVKKDHPALTTTINQSKDIAIVNRTDWILGRQCLNALRPERGLYQ